MTTVNCPYCNDEQEIDIEYDESRLIHTCDNCVKKFAVGYSVDVDIEDVLQAPCLNGEPDNHANKTVGTRDGKTFRHRCLDCGKSWESDKK